MNFSNLIENKAFINFIQSPIFVLTSNEEYKPTEYIKDFKINIGNEQIKIIYKIFKHSNITFNSNKFHNIENEDIKNTITQFNKELENFIINKYKINLENDKGFYINNSFGKLRFNFIFINVENI